MKKPLLIPILCFIAGIVVSDLVGADVLVNYTSVVIAALAAVIVIFSHCSILL